MPKIMRIADGTAVYLSGSGLVNIIRAGERLPPTTNDSPFVFHRDIARNIQEAVGILQREEDIINSGTTMSNSIPSDPSFSSALVTALSGSWSAGGLRQNNNRRENILNKYPTDENGLHVIKNPEGVDYYDRDEVVNYFERLCYLKYRRWIRFEAARTGTGRDSPWIKFDFWRYQPNRNAVLKSIFQKFLVYAPGIRQL